MKGSDILLNFANRTSLHGVPKVIVARSAISRFIWATICITASLIFAVQISQVLRRFFSFPKKVTIEVIAIPVPFPAVSLCNMRNLDFHVLNLLNRRFIADPYPQNHVNYSEHTFVREYMRMVARYGPLFYKYQEQLPLFVFQEVFSRTMLSANIPHDVINEAGVQLDDFVVTCHFGGNKCNRSTDFSMFFDSYYFNCFTYTAPPSDGKHGDMLSLSEGIENGWSAVVLTGSGMLDKNVDLRVLPGLHESRSAVAASEGVRVVVHPPDTQPFPFAEGYDVPPGYSASLGVRPRRNMRIGPPHGNCSWTNPFDPDSGHGGSVQDDGDGTDGHKSERRYRGITCQKMCLQSHVVAECQCYDSSLPMLPDFTADRSVKPCRRDDEFSDSCMHLATDDCLAALLTMFDRIQCVRQTRDLVTRNTTMMSECRCHPPCDEFLYDISYSLSKWPASGYEGDAAYMDIFYVEEFRERFANTSKNESVWDYFRDENRESTVKDFARLNVYIADSNVIVTQETPDYDPNQLVSDIGGQLGIWVGISVITLSEVVELVYLLFCNFVRGWRNVPPAARIRGRRRNSAPTSAPTQTNGRCLRGAGGDSDSAGGGGTGTTTTVALADLDDEIGWIEYDKRFRPNEYMTYARHAADAGDDDGKRRFRFEPIERDRSAMYRNTFCDSFAI